MGSRQTRLPVFILHASASYRRGLADALDSTVFDVQHGSPGQPDPQADDHPTLFVVGDGSEEAILARRSPLAQVVVLVPSLDVDLYRRALAAGADGVAQVDSEPETIAEVVRAAVIGEVVLPAEVARRLAGKPRPRQLVLTAEERALLQRVSDGATVTQLAQEFYLAERSVRRRLQNIFLRLGAHGRAEALKIAAQVGLVE